MTLAADRDTDVFANVLARGNLGILKLQQLTLFPFTHPIKGHFIDPFLAPEKHLSLYLCLAASMSVR